MCQNYKETIAQLSSLRQTVQQDAGEKIKNETDIIKTDKAAIDFVIIFI
ncbi:MULTISPECIES: hypothetical protein [Ignatzschineria]|nr:MULTISPECIES: hypothetical protein [Ignatzschineria]